MNRIWLKYLPRSARERIEHRPDLQKILGNTGWLFGDRILRMAVGLIVGAWVARYLGPDQFGTYNYALAFVSLFAPLATLGLDGIAVRSIIRDPSLREETLGTVFVLKLSGATFAFVVTIGALFLLRPADSMTRWLVGISAAGLIFQSFDVIDFWFQSQVQSRYSVYARNAAFLIIALAKVLMILINAPLIAFAWAGFAEIAAGALGLLIAYRGNKQHIGSWHASFGRARLLLADSWPLILSGLSIMVYMKINQVMLGEMVDSSAVGIYSVATKVSELWYFIPSAIVSSVFPAIIETKMQSEDMYYKRLQKLFNLMTILSLSIAIPMTFLSAQLISLLFGNEYQSAGPVLAIHIWAAVFVFLGVAQTSWDISENLTRLALMRTATGALLIVTLNLFLIPRFSVIGAAFTTVIAQAFSAVILNCVSVRTRPIFLMQIHSIIPVRMVKA